jgi:hypothetical protein
MRLEVLASRVASYLGWRERASVEITGRTHEAPMEALQPGSEGILSRRLDDKAPTSIYVTNLDAGRHRPTTDVRSFSNAESRFPAERTRQSLNQDRCNLSFFRLAVTSLCN